MNLFVEKKNGIMDGMIFFVRKRLIDERWWATIYYHMAKNRKTEE